MSSAHGSITSLENHMLYKAFSSVALLAVLLFAGLSYHNSQNVGFQAGDMGVNRFGYVSTSTSVAVGSDLQTTVLATSTARRYALIRNTGSNAVCLGLSDDRVAPVGTFCNGIYLAASGGEWEIDETNLYFGPIVGRATTATTTVSVIEVND